ncbi:MAG TPA: hypothetical protein VMK65_05505 [Longimicrobiales bacterium]|nr:hypothetical protein [Longimicrobiales bacterium]
MRGHGAAATLSIAAALALAGCGGEAPGPAAGVERFDSAGLTVVRWSGEGHPAPLDPAAESALLDASAVPDLRRGDVAVGPDGAVHVLDRAGRRVLVFTPGTPEPDTLGAAPPGDPDALVAPTLLAVGPDGRVAVFDRPRRGVVLFGGEGNRGLLRLPQPLQGEALAWTELGLLGVVGGFASSDSLDFRLQAFRLTGPAADLASLRVPVPQLLDPADCPVAIPFPRPFESRLVWAARGERVAVNAGAEYRITLLEGGEPRMVIEGARAPRAATPRLAAAQLADTVVLGDGAGCRVVAADVVKRVGHGPLVPAVSALALAPDGTLWVGRDGEGVDLYDRGGDYLGTLAPGTPFPAAFVSHDRYLAVVAEPGGPALVPFRLRRRAP